MAHKEYSLILTQVPNGGWTIQTTEGTYRPDDMIAAYSNKSHMLTGLSDLIDEKERSDE